MTLSDVLNPTAVDTLILLIVLIFFWLQSNRADRIQSQIVDMKGIIDTHLRVIDQLHNRLNLLNAEVKDLEERNNNE